MGSKILQSLKRVSAISLSSQKQGKKVGLVIGGFDVLHMGHLNLFRQAKKYVDILIVGLDNDNTLRINKGKGRPINNFKRRSQFLADITNVDYIFKIGKVLKHGEKSSIYFTNLYKKIRPTHIFTHVATDSMAGIRRKIGKSLNIKFVADKTKTVTHSTDIIRKLEQEL